MQFFYHFGLKCSICKFCKKKGEFYVFDPNTQISIFVSQNLQYMALQGREAPCFIWIVLYCWPHKKILLREKGNLLYFYSINLGLKMFSLLPWKFHRHIDLVVDFINLGLAKLLWPQDTVCVSADFMSACYRLMKIYPFLNFNPKFII